MRFSPGCNCCMTWGWEARRSFSDCKKFQHITYLKDDDRIEKVYDCDVVVIGQLLCDVPRPDLDEDQLDTVRDYLEKGGKVIALGEYKGCISSEERDQFNDALEQLGSSCSLFEVEGCNCTCNKGTSDNPWLGELNPAVSFLADYDGIIHACTNKVAGGKWWAKTENGLFDNGDSDPEDDPTVPECGEPFVFIAVEQIGDGLLLVSGDSNLFDCHDENCDFWTAFTQSRIEDLL